MRLANFDRAVIGEISVNFLGPTLSLVAKSKLVSTQNGLSYGSATIQHWTPKVMEKLDELKALMEQEIEQAIFTGGDTRTSATSEGGLGEQFSEDEAPSV